jgi:hypothetical protein
MGNDPGGDCRRGRPIRHPARTIAKGGSGYSLHSASAARRTTATRKELSVSPLIHRQIAQIIIGIDDVELRVRVAHHFAVELHKSNPNFDRNWFFWLAMREPEP